MAAETDWLGAQGRKTMKPRASRAPAPLEKDVQEAVVAWLRRVLPSGSVVQAVRNEAAPRSKAPHARARFHAARKKAGLEWGFPDLVLIVPGRTLFLELKRPVDGEVRASQADMHARIRATGHTVGVATCIDTARRALLDAGVPLAEAAGQPAPAAKVRTAKARRRGRSFALAADRVPGFDGAGR